MIPTIVEPADLDIAPSTPTPPSSIHAQHVEARQRRHALHSDRSMGAHKTGRSRLDAAIRRPSAQERDTAAESQEAEGGCQSGEDGTGHKVGLCVLRSEE